MKLKTLQEIKDAGEHRTSRQNTIWSDEISYKCEHNWQPVSMVFETQLLDSAGRVLVRQPDIENAKVYCVCLKCCSHTYYVTGWCGAYQSSPDILEVNWRAEHGEEVEKDEG